MKNYLISIFLLYSITLSSQLMGGFMSPTHTVTDIDGNEYKTVKIGTQIWMAENLRTATYNNGTSIPNVTSGSTWSGLTSGAWCYYDNNSSYNIPYGKLYNGYTIDNGNLCPTGWHVPDNGDFNTLINYNSTLTDSGFNAVFAGRRLENGNFYNPLSIGGAIYFFSSTFYTTTQRWVYIFYGQWSSGGRDTKVLGHSVRCIKD